MFESRRRGKFICSLSILHTASVNCLPARTVAAPTTPMSSAKPAPVVATTPGLLNINTSVHKTGINQMTSTAHPQDHSDAAPIPLAAVIPLAALLVIMIIISTLGNSIVCLIVYRKPAMRSAINLLLANLAFADIMVSVTCMPFALVSLIKGSWIFGDHLCNLTAFFYVLFVMEAILILASISVDRYFIIVRRKDKLNPYKAKLLIGLSWFCSLTVAFPPLIIQSFEYIEGYPQCQVRSPLNVLDKVYIVFALSSIFFLPFTAMSFSYMYILNTVRKNSLRVENHPKSLSISQATKLGLAGVHHRPSRVNVDMSFKTRAFTTILLLFIVYVFCWAPYTVGSMYNCFSPELIEPLLWTVLMWMTYLNSAFNPIIYCWRIKKFREACYDLMPKTCKLLPHLPGRARRRIKPSAIYECNELEQSSAV